MLTHLIFFKNFSTGDLPEQISVLGAPREKGAFEDVEKMQEAVFADLGDFFICVSCRRNLPIWGPCEPRPTSRQGLSEAHFLVCLLAQGNNLDPIVFC